MDVRALVIDAARRHKVPEDLALEVAGKESGFVPGRVSPKGARGVMQLMPGTARDLGVNPDDVHQNVDGGVRYLKQQLDTFGGDRRLAKAAYNSGPGNVRKYGGVPPFRETQKYVGGGDVDQLPSAAELLSGGKAKPFHADQAPGGEELPSAAELLGERASPPPGAVRPPQVGAAKVVRRDQVLGFEKGAMKPLDNLASGLEYAAGKVGLDKPINRLGEVLGLPSAKDANAQHADYIAQQAAKGVIPGKIGEFAGNVLGTALMTKGMSPLTGGAVSGALLSDKADLKGVAGDAALGGVVGRGTALASDALQVGARKLLSKAPQVMDLPGLEQAVKAAYGKVDASGFKVSTADMKGLASSVMTDLRAKGGPKAAKLYPDADAFTARLDALSRQKGGVKLTQLDDLRSDIYDAMIKPGGKEAAVGKAIRTKIDGLIDNIPNADIKGARELYTRLSKMRTVTKTLDSAELRKSAAYSGANTDNTIRQQIRPLLDPTSGKVIRNATADEKAALRKVVEGSGLQNLSRLTGQGLDPRKLLGKLSGIGALGAAGPTAGASLIAPAVGLIGTTISNRASQSNVQQLLKLMAAGGSKQALKPVPTRASAVTEKAIARVLRPTAVAAAVPALAAARTHPKPKQKK